MADRGKPMTVLIEDARLIFKNFAGKETPMNRAGERNFAVVLPPDVAEQMAADGWNVRVREPKEEGDEPFFFISVKVKFNNYPPTIILITSKKRTHVDEGMVDTLDYAEIKTVDLIINSYNWTMASGKTGVACYLKKMYVTIEEDELDLKYGIQGRDADDDD